MGSAPCTASRHGAREAEDRSGGPAAPTSEDERGARVAIAAFLIVGVTIRLVTLPAVGFEADVASLAAWAQRVATVGPGAFYAPGYHHSGYQPGILYVLGALGALLDGEALRLAVKALSIPADVAIVLVVAAFVRRHGGPAAAVRAAALWSLAPAAIFAGSYWGQLDSVGSLAFLGALLAAGSRRWALAGALAGAAVMVKPQFGLAPIVVGAAAVFEALRTGDRRGIVRVPIAGLVTVVALALPFRQSPFDLLGLVREASELYPYSSLYAFNPWSVVLDFWTPDDAYVRIGAALLIAGIAASCAPLWWRRDTAMLLVAGTLASAAFYFLPTRSHERYLFPAFVLLLPLAATRARLLVPYVVLGLTFFVTLYFALSRYPQNGLSGPAWTEATLFSRPGQIALAIVLIGGFAYMVWLLLRGEARLEPDVGAVLPHAAPARRWELPAGLMPGRAPSRRDYVVAFLVALTVLATRGYRLDQPRDMYFDEVYHARTAFELLAQREPYEWTHPHLAKEIMALGILAFGDDRVIGHEDIPANALRFAVTNDGARVYALPDAIEIRDRGGSLVARHATVDSKPLAVAVEGDRVIVLGDRGIAEFSTRDTAIGALSPREVPAEARQARLLVAAGGRVVVGGDTATLVYSTLDASPVVVRTPSVAIAAKPDGSELYLLDPKGTVRVVDPQTGTESRSFPGAPGTAIAYAEGPKRVFVARADEPSLDVLELEGGRRETVPLANARTGTFATGATALAVVPRTQFLYALADGRLVIAETHGASPYAAIPTTATRLGVDGTGDALLLQGEGGLDLVETGRHALAWRLPGVVFGAILAFFLVLLARRLFASPLVAAFTGALVVFDGSMFAQPRIGMNDVYAGAFLVAAWYFVVAAHRPRRSASFDLLLAGVLFGLALASKWVAAYAIVALALLSIVVTVRAFDRDRLGEGGPLDLFKWRGLNALFLFACFAAVPIAIYLLAYRSWFGGPIAPFGWDLVELTKQMYWYHSGLTSPHPAGSPWWSWPFVLKPVYWYYAASEDGGSAVIYDAGNVVIFWAAFAATIWCAIAAVRMRSVSLGFIVFALLAQLVSWIPITRVLFFYHFFTALPYYLIALAAALSALWERGRRRLVASYLVVAALAFLFFYPFVSGQPVAADEAGIFFILPTWQYGCQFYPSFTCELSGPQRIEPVAIIARLGVPLSLGLLVLALTQLPLERLRLRLFARRPPDAS